jgi:hypothetical protein
LPSFDAAGAAETYCPQAVVAEAFGKLFPHNQPCRCYQPIISINKPSDWYDSCSRQLSHETFKNAFRHPHFFVTEHALATQQHVSALRPGCR